MQADNQLNGQPCDNISSKNDSYCELTVMYWAWKNLKTLYPNVKYVGLCHYRRYFAMRNFPFRAEVAKPESDIAGFRVDAEKVTRILDGGKIILPKQLVFPLSVKTQYCLCHTSEGYTTTENVIRTKFPDYYDDFIDVMERGNKASFLNMFIMKYEDFAEYCEWLFAVLAEVEPQVPYQSYNTYQRRVFAFIAERLLNVYVRKNNMRPAYSSVYFCSEGAGNNASLLHCARSYCRDELIFRISMSAKSNRTLRRLKDGVKKLLGR